MTIGDTLKGVQSKYSIFDIRMAKIFCSDVFL